VPFLRGRLMGAAARGPRVAGPRDLAPAQLAGQRWLLGPPDLDPTTGAWLLFARTDIQPEDLVAYTSHAAAIAAAAAGDGIVVTLAHAVLEELRRRALVRVDVRGTPMLELWHASTLGFGRALPAALAMQRFATSSEAAQAISTGRAGTSSARARPRPHVALWSSMAEDLRAGRA
jgi:DNA-binding transcriptional LysR family regulator